MWKTNRMGPLEGPDLYFLEYMEHATIYTFFVTYFSTFRENFLLFYYNPLPYENKITTMTWHNPVLVNEQQQTEIAFYYLFCSRFFKVNCVCFCTPLYICKYIRLPASVMVENHVGASSRGKHAEPELWRRLPRNSCEIFSSDVHR